MALLDLLSIIKPTVEQEKDLSTERDPLLFQLSTASAAIENILTVLARAEKLRVEDSAAINGGSHKSRQHEVTKSTSDDKQENAPLKTELSTSFKDIVGNYDAKQALYENVVLPLTICDATKVNIFSGK